MDPDASAHQFILTPSALHSVYCDAKASDIRDDDDIIDLGLSLRTLQPDQGDYDPPPAAAAPPPHLVGLEVAYAAADYCCCGEEAEVVVESKLQRWAYVKVNMDGVVVGRKVCIFQHSSYSSLALQLEDMFGRQCESGLRLFETESEYNLFYKDGDEIWRRVGDVPWKQFVEGVKRLRIARKDEAFVVIHQS